MIWRSWKFNGFLGFESAGVKSLTGFLRIWICRIKSSTVFLDLNVQNKSLPVFFIWICRSWKFNGFFRIWICRSWKFHGVLRFECEIIECLTIFKSLKSKFLCFDCRSIDCVAKASSFITVTVNAIKNIPCQFSSNHSNFPQSQLSQSTLRLCVASKKHYGSIKWKLIFRFAELLLQPRSFIYHYYDYPTKCTSLLCISAPNLGRRLPMGFATTPVRYQALLCCDAR